MVWTRSINVELGSCDAWRWQREWRLSTKNPATDSSSQSIHSATWITSPRSIDRRASHDHSSHACYSSPSRRLHSALIASHALTIPSPTSRLSSQRSTSP